MIENSKKKLRGAHFRWLNEQLYTQDSTAAVELFQKSPELFEIYHSGFREQVESWPVHPLDLIIEKIKKMTKKHQQKKKPTSASASQSKKLRIGDFGCGDARLAQTLYAEKGGRKRFKVHSFDLVAVNEYVTEADMAHVPLEDGSLDVVVICLALMGTNVADFLREAARTLVPGGTLLIAEVQSRFETYAVPRFIWAVELMGFAKLSDSEVSKMFHMFTFRKQATAPEGKFRPPKIQLKPCVYKKR